MSEQSNNNIDNLKLQKFEEDYYIENLKIPENNTFEKVLYLQEAWTNISLWLSELENIEASNDEIKKDIEKYKIELEEKAQILLKSFRELSYENIYNKKIQELKNRYKDIEQNIFENYNEYNSIMRELIKLKIFKIQKNEDIYLSWQQSTIDIIKQIITFDFININDTTELSRYQTDLIYLSPVWKPTKLDISIFREKETIKEFEKELSN